MTTHGHRPEHHFITLNCWNRWPQQQSSDTERCGDSWWACFCCPQPCFFLEIGTTSPTRRIGRCLKLLLWRSVWLVQTYLYQVYFFQFCSQVSLNLSFHISNLAWVTWVTWMAGTSNVYKIWDDLPSRMCSPSVPTCTYVVACCCNEVLSLGAAEQLTKNFQFGRRVDPHEPQAGKTQVTRRGMTWYCNVLQAFTESNGWDRLSDDLHLQRLQFSYRHRPRPSCGIPTCLQNEACRRRRAGFCALFRDYKSMVA